MHNGSPSSGSIRGINSQHADEDGMQTRMGIVLLLTIALVTPAAMAVFDPVEGQTGLVAQQNAVDADNVRITVQLSEDGTAEWTLAFRSILETENRTAAFESLQADISDDPESYTAPFAERVRRSVAVAENTTDREMSAGEFNIDTSQQSLGREYGIVTYRFRWNGFAARSDETLTAGDAIDGYYLADGTRLRIEWPDGYDRQSVSPAPDETRDNAVIWTGGQTDFGPGEPRVTVAASGPGIGLFGGIAAVALLAILGGWYLRRQRGDDAGPTAATPTADTETADTSAVDTATADGDTETADSSAADTTATDADTTATDATTTADGDAVATEQRADADAEQPADHASGEPDPDLLSNEERVLQLLDANGGRMKQKHVVEELGWTDAKTSKVVSGLRDDDEIESFRIGRENVLTFPDEGLTDE